MKHMISTLLFIATMIAVTGCGTPKNTIRDIIEGTDTPTSISTESAVKVADDSPTGNDEKPITDEQALDAVKNYCHQNNPALEEMEDSEEYNIYWDVSTNDDNEIVVLYRSYTGSQIRYYINPLSGDTHVTELVPGIMDEEEGTDERFNVRDYFD